MQLRNDGYAGMMTAERLSIRPAGFVTAKSEVVYLMEALDEDGDKIISVEEVLAEPQTFLESQV